jgi:2',3'-cyclic-nucleotide 2'-phosphodiesterase (5'-nucleotidase family)
MTLGNREFDNGPVFAATFMRSIPNTKVVISNMDWRAEPTFRSLTNIVPYTVMTKGGHQYGIVGVVLDELFESSSPGKNLFVTPALEALPDALRQLKRETGVNKVRCCFS